MHRKIWILSLLSLLFGLSAGAQTVILSNEAYAWPAAPTGNAGQLSSYLVFNGTNFPRPGNYTIDVSVSGTAPATCTFRTEGSSDGTAWYGLDVTSPNTQSCTANFMESITSRPVLFLRINLTYTQGDGTTKVVFHWTGGRS